MMKTKRFLSILLIISMLLSNVQVQATNNASENSVVINSASVDSIADIKSETQTLEYTYNYKQQLIKKQTNGQQVKYEYDDHYTWNSVVAPYEHRRTYALDDLGRIEFISADDRSFWCQYTGNGLIKSVDYPGSDLKTTYTYDDMNRLTRLTTANGTQTIVDYTYTYDNVGNVLTVSGSENVVYTYDDLYRLKTVTQDNITTTYEYDGRNNLISETTSDGITKEYQYSGDNRLKKVIDGGEETTYEYDLNGNLIADSNGNEYAYNEDNQLIYSKVDDVETTYTIGVDGYRNKKKTDDDITTYFLDESGHVITETDGYDKVTQIIWNGIQPIAKKVDNKYYFYIYNGHGDVVALLDENGTVQNEYTYSPWGEQTIKKENVENSIGYAGEYQDKDWCKENVS